MSSYTRYSADAVAMTRCETAEVIDVALLRRGTTVKKMREIAGAIEHAGSDQQAATKEVCSNINQAATVTRDVSKNISGVTLAAQETSSGASQVLEAAQEREVLQKSVEGFLVSVRAGEGPGCQSARWAEAHY